MNSEWLPITLLVSAWIIYGAVHSLLASLTFKEWLFHRWPALQPAYRILFNVVAVITLAPQMFLILIYKGETVFSWPPEWQWLAHTLSLLAIIGFIWSLKFYDLQEFLGLKQWRNRHQPAANSDAQFVISPLHRFVRHPWYSFAFVLMWAREMDAMMLATSIIVSGYFIIGAYFEERKLVKLYGDAYQKYRRQVPGLVPLPWRYLTTKEALTLASPPAPTLQKNQY